jgi:ATP-dependent Clp protease ATP-binding subunit ClpC
MFERFNHPARVTVVLSQEEARQLRHRRIGPQHLLLAVASLEMAGVEPDPVLASVLARLGLRRETIYPLVGATARQRRTPPKGFLPFTDDSKAALERTLAWSIKLDNPAIEPVHVLLGVASASTGAAAEVLFELGLEERDVVAAVYECLGLLPPPDEPTPTLTD